MKNVSILILMIVLMNLIQTAHAKKNANLEMQVKGTNLTKLLGQ